MLITKVVTTSQLKLLAKLNLVLPIENYLLETTKNPLEITKICQKIQQLLQSVINLYKNNNNLEIEKIWQKLGLNSSQKTVATDLVIDSVSVKTSFEKELQKQGIIFCSISKAIKNYPELVKTYLGKVVPFTDNYFACLNSAVFGDGSFVFIPKNVHCPMDLSTYFRLNNQTIGQFERTLIIAEANSQVSYLEGCTAPTQSNNQLHSAVVELIAMENAYIQYATVQNWYIGTPKKLGGVYNFVTKRGLCQGKNSQIDWTQVETGSAITWKYPSVILKGENSKGNFYSLSITKNHQQADTGTKMIHIGRNTKSYILSKSLIYGNSVNNYRSLVKIAQGADNSRNYTKCDSISINPSRKRLKPKIAWTEIESLLDKLDKF
jgi:Fe-S cluster assembly protein SufB